MSTEILVGGAERVTIDFADIDGAAVDPTGTIVVTVTQPDGTTTSYSLAGGTVINDPAATGRFYIDHPITQVGIHTAKGVATQPSAAAITRFVSVG